MKRTGQLIQLAADPQNLRLAYWKASKGKRYAHEVTAYRINLDARLMLLREQMLAGHAAVGNYRYFKVFEPKERNICASAFSEQVLHHALMNVCHDRFEKALICDSYASRKGKGTYAALDRAKHFCGKYGWYLKLDVRKFFESVHHEVLKKQLHRLFKDRVVLALFEQIIDSYQTSPLRGVPIGNLTSQYFSNHYLSDLDHFIKEKLGFKAYVRYMDDMVLWHNDKASLLEAKHRIEVFVMESLHCFLKPEQLNQSALGLPFLGYNVFPQTIRLTQQSKQRFIWKMFQMEEKYHNGTWNDDESSRHALPLIAFTQHADSLPFRKKLYSKNTGMHHRALTA
ncbi:MAG: RNA-directed DNA polymerase [Saprospiraceae bacterium]|nr:RNA-directed DNA polymerase [Saprospiraceae bacterium]